MLKEIFLMLLRHEAVLLAPMHIALLRSAFVLWKPIKLSNIYLKKCYQDQLNATIL